MLLLPFSLLFSGTIPATARCMHTPVEGPYNYAHFRPRHAFAELAKTWLLTGPQPGDLAPAFQLPDVDGASWRVDGPRDRPVLLHFGSYT